MALFRSRLFKGALFAGALFGAPESVTPPAPPQTPIVVGSAGFGHDPRRKQFDPRAHDRDILYIIEILERENLL